MLAGTAALILVLSVFNGFEDLVISLFNKFNPDLKISAAQGKVFIPTAAQLTELKNLKGVKAISLSLEENALIQYNSKDMIVRLKGVDTNYTHVSAVHTTTDTTVFKTNQFLLSIPHHNNPNDTDTLPTDPDNPTPTQNKNNNFFAVLGWGIAASLGVNLDTEDGRYPVLKVFMPQRKEKVKNFSPENAFKQEFIKASGVFSIQMDFDNKYAFVPIEFMNQLLEYHNGEISSIEVAINEGFGVETVQKTIQSTLGANFEVQTRYQQDAMLYKVMKTEKWVVYCILSFILLVAAFNIIGSLSMLVLEKQKDISILKSMGANNLFIKKIFLYNGIILGIAGAGIGMFLAFIACLLQQHFQIIQLEGVSFLVNAYPVSMRASDFALVAITVIIISALAAYYPAYKASKQTALFKY